MNEEQPKSEIIKGPGKILHAKMQSLYPTLPPPQLIPELSRRLAEMLPPGLAESPSGQLLMTAWLRALGAGQCVALRKVTTLWPDDHGSSETIRLDVLKPNQKHKT